MDMKELRERGIALRKQIFGAPAVEKRMGALGEFGAPLQELINAYGYGDVWSRPGLDRKVKSLVVIGMNAAINRRSTTAARRTRFVKYASWSRCMSAFRRPMRRTALPSRCFRSED